MREKMVYLGEWVKARNMMNKHFRAKGPCAICTKMKCDAVWYSIKSGEVRCTDCFDAEAEHYR